MLAYVLVVQENVLREAQIINDLRQSRIREFKHE